MLIHELTRQASLDLLAHTRLARLACANGAQPYVVPFYFALDNNYLYSFSTVGQAIEWMRANPLVCVEADEVVSSQNWVSLVVFGRYEELPNTPEWQSARETAFKVLQRNAIWWEPGYAPTIVHGTQRPLVPVYYRIHIVQITGRRATPKPVAPPDTRLPLTDLGQSGWLQRILRQVRAILGNIVIASRIDGRTRYSHTNSSRSAFVRRAPSGVLGRRALSWCGRTRFSASSLAGAVSRS